MKNSKKMISLVAFLGLALLALNSCTSETVSEPAPTGPSSIGVVLTLTASPNVIAASPDKRQTAKITATLKKYDGIPLAGKTIYFSMKSGRSAVGYFEDKLDVLVKTTDANGTAETIYSGPLRSEINKNTTLYIEATVAWEGSQFISESTPIIIVRTDD